MKTEFIHYGHDRFSPELFWPIQNRKLFSKPAGGLWASPVDARYGWREWCEDNDFAETNESNSFRFRIKGGSNVLHITSVAHLDGIPMQETPFPCSFRCPDFEELIRRGVDAMWVDISADRDLYMELYGWDCDSIVVFNPDVIEPIKEKD